MKPRILAFVLFAGAVIDSLAQSPAPRLLGVATPSADAIPTPEAVVLHALSDDGRWLLLTSTSDGLTTNDLNAAADVFLFDRIVGRTSLVSATPGGFSGNGTSLASGMTPDAGQIAFLNRASNFATADTNGTWDVFVHELANGTNRLASPSSQGGSSAAAASEPMLSADGHYVVFRSPAVDLAPNPFLLAFNLYRRDLVEGRTECLTTNLPFRPLPLQPIWRLGSWAASPDAHAIVFTGFAVSGTTASNVVAWRNLVTGQYSNCSAVLPAEVRTPQVTHSAPAVSPDTKFIAFRSEVKLAGTVQREALCLHQVDSGLTTLLSLRTNDTARQTFPASDFNAVLSADGHSVAYSAPLPTYQSSASIPTNGPSQAYLYDASSQTTRLLSTASDGITPANADAGEVRLTPDGRFVFFVSRATNLVAAATTEAIRLYMWSRETVGLTAIGDLGEGDPDGRYVISPNGQWVAFLAENAGARTVYYLQTAEMAVTYARLPLAVEESSTARGWIGLQPAGVSADGRYVALTAFPAGPLGDSNHMQIHLHDTQTRTRQLLSRGVDGNLLGAHPAPPVLSADGKQLLFASAATNLVAADINGAADFFVQTLPTGERRILRQAPLTAGAPAQAPCLLSPDGGVAFVTFLEGTKPVSRLADVASGKFAVAFPGVAVGLPSFSRTGQKIAVSFGSSTPTSGANPRIEVHDVAAWLSGGIGPKSALWTSSLQAVEPVMSADGSRVAFFNVSSTGINAVVVMDWARNQLLFAKRFNQQIPSNLGLSADGGFAVWVSSGLLPGSPNQVWRANVEGNQIELLSVAPDGASEGNGNSKYAAISADGRYVAFASLASNLVADDTNCAKDVFLRDTQTGQTLLLSRTVAGEAGAGWSLQPFFSANGNCLFFLSHAPDLAPGDYNQAVDLFKVEIVSDSDLLVVIRHSLSSGQVELLWNAEAGKQYRIEFKDDLGVPAWTTLPGTFTGESPVAVDAQGHPHRFFRVAEAQ